MTNAINLTKKAAVTMAAVGLMSMGTLGVAHAAESASTAVQLKTDASLLSVTAPDVIAGVVNADGSITFPSSDALKIENKSVFPINVASAETTAGLCTPIAEGSYESSSAVNAMKLSILPTGGTLDNAQAFDAGSALDSSVYLQGSDDAKTGWTMAANGQNGSSVNLEVTGATKNLDIDLETAKKAFDITWTFAPGNSNGKA